MYKPSNTFSIEILTIFISRVQSVLNTIYKGNVNSFDGESFSFRNSGTFNFVAFKKSPENAIIIWSKDENGLINDIKTNFESFENLSMGDNLTIFTHYEQQLMGELIKKENETAMSEIETHIQNIFNSEPLGEEFERVLEENLDKLYES